MKKIRKIMEIIVMVYVFAIAMGSSLPAEASTKLATPKVTVAKTSSNSVAIKWKKIGSAKKYYIYCSENGEKYKRIATTTDKIYIHNKLELGAKYSYKVKAINGKKSNNYSRAKSITTDNEGYLLDLIQPYDKSSSYKDFSNDSFEMAGDYYSHGFTCSGNNGTTYFNLHGDYSTLSFYVGTVNPGNAKECKVNIYIDNKLADSFVIGSHDIPIKKEIDVKNGQKLAITTVSDTTVFCGIFGFGEVKLKL